MRCLNLYSGLNQANVGLRLIKILSRLASPTEQLEGFCCGHVCSSICKYSKEASKARRSCPGNELALLQCKGTAVYVATNKV
jgi:hypothetical protein